jgi:DNA topoisomerase-3
VVFASATAEKKDPNDLVMPTFTKGESGPHEPSFTEKQTKAPRQYTEASLLRAMETAGKQVDDEELRDLMKANGIGRPSTRANIIETLFKRKYIQRNKKQIIPTSTGVQLIGLVDNALLKSAELTGQWEKQLKEIEAGEYSASQFIKNMKVMVDDLVAEVRLAKPKVIVSAQPAEQKKKTPTKNGLVGHSCPKCNEGRLLKGKTGFGCSRWNEGCHFLLPTSFLDKKVSDTQLLRLLTKGETTVLKGFKKDGEKVNGRLKLSSDFAVELHEKVEQKEDGPLVCPKCKKGEVIKGQTAFGCNRWKEDCDFKMTFEEVRTLAKGKPISKQLVRTLLQSAY